MNRRRFSTLGGVLCALACILVLIAGCGSGTPVGALNNKLEQEARTTVCHTAHERASGYQDCVDKLKGLESKLGKRVNLKQLESQLRGKL